MHYSVKDYSFFIMPFACYNVTVGILLTCAKHLHGRIISLRGEVYVGSTKPCIAFDYFYDFSIGFWNCSDSFTIAAWFWSWFTRPNPQSWTERTEVEDMECSLGFYLVGS